MYTLNSSEDNTVEVEGTKTGKQSGVSAALGDVGKVLSLLIEKLDKNKKDDYLTDDLDKDQIRSKTAQKRFEEGKYVALGMLIERSDKGFAHKQPQTQVHIGESTRLKTKAKYHTPENWEEFILLLTRLIQGYLQNGHDAKITELFKYMENLQKHRNTGAVSDKALIHYDEQVRYTSTKPFSWLEFDTQAFLLASNSYPIKKTSYGERNLGNNVKNKPHSRSFRTQKGTCNRWKKGEQCSYESKDKGCRFAHWCINDQCIKKNNTDHRYDQCPNKKPKNN